MRNSKLKNQGKEVEGKKRKIFAINMVSFQSQAEKSYCQQQNMVLEKTLESPLD